MRIRPLQLFHDDYLKNTKKLTSEQILTFLDQFRNLYANQNQKVKSKLISIKIPENLLDAFKTKASLEGIPYQRLIKKLMKNYLQ